MCCNASERDFLTLTDVEPSSRSFGGTVEHHPFLVLARAQIVFVVTAAEPEPD